MSRLNLSLSLSVEYSFVRHDYFVTLGNINRKLLQMCALYQFSSRIKAIKAVSYTHLDVYKRQVMNCVWLYGFSLNPSNSSCICFSRMLIPWIFSLFSRVSPSILSITVYTFSTRLITSSCSSWCLSSKIDHFNKILA